MTSEAFENIRTIKQFGWEKHFKEKIMKVNEKFQQIDDRIAKNNERKRLQSLVHREVDNLKFNDAMETRNNRSGRGNKDKYDIIEKHIGMSISLNEKKQ